MKVLSVVVIAGAMLFGALPSSAGAAPGNGESYHQAVCGAVPTQIARCNIDVSTDAQGNPAVQSSPDPTWFGPAQIHGAYSLPCTPNGVASPQCGTYAGGFTYAGGQIVAIVDAFNDPTIAKDINTYSSQFNIPSCPTGALSDSSKCLTVLGEKGGTKLPSTNTSWAEEISLDVDTVHQVCQTCKILLIETNSSSISDLATGVVTAASLGATEISNSYGALEFKGQTYFDIGYNHPGIAVVASAGDHGYGTQYPASSPNTVAVGGTKLFLNPDNSWNSEVVWGRLTHSIPHVPEGTGSGCSLVEPANTWQTQTGNWINTGCGNKRAVADVAADADPDSGVAVYASTNTTGTAGWLRAGGTSLAAPIIAGVFALAGGVRANFQAQQIPYEQFTNLNSHDVIDGNNASNTNGAACTFTAMCYGVPGYDGPTGLGTPTGVAGFQANSGT